MKLHILSFLTVLITSSAFAGNTNIYEKDEEPAQSQKKMQTFTSKVKLVREASRGVDVSFESNDAPGYYTLSPDNLKQADYVQYKAILSDRKLSSVKVTADKEDKIIQSVSVVEKTEKKPASQKQLMDEVDSNMDKLLKGK